MRRKLDEAAKLLFIGDVVADALRAALPELAALLRLDAVEPLPTAYVGPDRVKRFGDAAFRVRFAKGRFPAGEPAGGRRRGRRLYVLVAVEFQHRNDPGMARRVRDYAAWMEEHYRHQGVIRPGEHPPLLALVIHTGPGRWAAPDGTEVFRALPGRVARRLARYQPQAYIALDVSRHSTPGPPDGNRLAAVGRLAGSATARELAGRLTPPNPSLRSVPGPSPHRSTSLPRRTPLRFVLRRTLLAEEWRRFRGAADARFRRGMLAWAEEAVLGFPDSGFELPSFEELDGLEENDMAYPLDDRAQQWQAEWLEEGREEGRLAGRKEGQRAMLERLAEGRFGVDAARRLSVALNGARGGARLTELSDLVVGCENAEEFIERLED